MEIIDYIAKMQVGFIVTELFEEAVINASNGKLNAAVAIMEKTIPFIEQSDIHCERIYILGFYCQICLDTSRNDRAIWLYNLVLSHLNEKKSCNMDEYKDDMDMFLKLKSRIDELQINYIC